MADNSGLDAKREQLRRYADLIARESGKAVRPYRADGFVNLMNKYGTSKDTSEQYRFAPEAQVPDDLLTMFYEGNGLFAKIIDAPAEEAVKHGFTLGDVSDQKVEDFYQEALEELDFEETMMTSLKWARLFGGSIAVMLINDGGSLEEPLNWRRIRSIDGIRVFDRSLIQPDYESMFSYDPSDPFRARGSRLGMPERYQVFSKYGSFTVHDSRCLVFQNGILPENATNSIYQFWGEPEYVRLNRAIRDAEIAHGSAPKLLDRSVQAIYKMKDLSMELATEEGEERLLRRLQIIDMARGMMNSIAIDSEGEEYDFRTFQFSGVNDVIGASCNMLSAVSNIPQVILFGQKVGGLGNGDDTSMENWYNYIERNQKRMLKPNIRYLLSVIFQAGLATGEVDEVPKIKIEFNPLWSMTEAEKADLELKKEQTKLAKAQTAQTYVSMQAIDASEVRKKLADSDEFDVERILDEYEDEDLFPEGAAPEEGEGASGIFEQGSFADYGEGVDIQAHNADPQDGGNAPTAAPAATKLPQDMSDEEVIKKATQGHIDGLRVDAISNTAPDIRASVGVLVVKDGKILCGVRGEGFAHGQICGPGGHVKAGETYEQAAFRETEEEFGISPKELIPLGFGPLEEDTGLTPAVFLCTEYEGEPYSRDGEMEAPVFLGLDELRKIVGSERMFLPFSASLKLLEETVRPTDGAVGEDGGPGSGNFGHEGRPGEVGGSGESHKLGGTKNGELSSKMKDTFGKAKTGTKFSVKMNGAGGKESLEIYKVSDGYYVRSKSGGNSIVETAEEAVERCGIYVNERTTDKVMYEEFDVDIGEPGTEQADKFVQDYDAYKEAKSKLISGDYQITEVDDETAKDYADMLNNASKGKIVKLAEKDPQFKAVVDSISAYTQGEYVYQRKTAEGVLESGYDPSKDAILGDRLTDSMYQVKDMYPGQNLSVSKASVAEGMVNITKAIESSTPFEGELYRVAQDRSIFKDASSGEQGVYTPPTVGETIRIGAPTSFSKNKDAVAKIAKEKMGDIIYYTVEPGAKAVDVAKLSPYKQAELLSCGDYEVVKVESTPVRMGYSAESLFTTETLEKLKRERGAKVEDGYVSYPVLESRIVLRQKGEAQGDSAEDSIALYRPDDFTDRMVLNGVSER